MSDSNTPGDPSPQPATPYTPPPASPSLQPPVYGQPAYGAAPQSPPPPAAPQPPTYAQAAPGQPPYPISGSAPYGAPQQPYGTPPQAYGAPQQPYGYGYAAPRRTNALAVVSLVSSLAGFVLAWTWVLALGVVAGVITGHIALGRIKRTGEGGRGMALAGVIVGWVGIGLGVLGILAFAMFFAVGSSYGSYS
ncbi:DUF4190 domain-containing protein [Microbacterium sp. W1N]|uniref:DUF4190 domain-containing protein n=1 Tax=Microbacterium festucae TaxID=2977531 RepID=UPI0021BEDBC4|nr:DUF4190 domain-containing protein [Microbacterium festucae]MCT9819991.1 DUF4190 domain-containing protein [Microbacterium festucae]